MRFESRRGQNEEKCKKNAFLQFEKTYFLYSSFVGWSFGFAFER
jgi:hypothetical protein